MYFINLEKKFSALLVKEKLRVIAVIFMRHQAHLNASAPITMDAGQIKSINGSFLFFNYLVTLYYTGYNQSL